MIRVSVSNEALALFPCKEIERSKDDVANNLRFQNKSS